MALAHNFHRTPAAIDSMSDNSWSILPKWPENAQIKEYVGGCHCKKIRFKLSHPPFEHGEMKVVSCNCSICNQHGLCHMYVLS